ncbi:hypothetical protein ACHAXT_006702 [Thalassiosira profunda]
MGLRDIFRPRAGGSGADQPAVYPPEDKLTWGFEQVFVTLALLVVSYVILATPWFSTSTRRLTTRLNAEAWVEDVKQLRYVRSVEDLQRWWQRVRRGRRERSRGFDPQRWNEMMRSSGNNGYESDLTVRAKGGSSAPSTPLRSMFRRGDAKISQQKKHGSTGLLAGSPRTSPEKTAAERERADSSFFEEAARPETDEDRFAEAWKTQIRYAEYRRLVLPPECKLVQFTFTVNWKETEKKLLENLLDESRWKKITSYIQNVVDVLIRIYNRLFSKETIQRFSDTVLNRLRNRLRRRYGLSVGEEEEDTDDDDDGSVVTNASSVEKRRRKPGPSPNLPEKTPVISNRRFLSKSDVVNGKGPPIESVPQLPIQTKSGVYDSRNGGQQQNGRAATPPLIDGDKTVPQAGRSPLRPRANTSGIDDDAATFVSASGGESSDASSRSSLGDIPTTVMSKNKLKVSPLPVKQFNRQKKRDALDNYRRPDAIPITMPSLKTTLAQEPMPGSSPKSSPNLKPLNPPPTPPESTLADSSMNFFDTATSDRQLRDMSRAVPIPDANGYILGDEFLHSSCAPLLVFVNSRSGPQQGRLLITQFRRLLNPIQVYDLANGGPEKVLKSFSVLSRFQVLICGGDGTVSWIISALEKMDLKRWPPIGILPLGTGNDLARIHGWGGGYNNESLLYVLRQISDAYISMLDLWELDISSVTKKGKERKEVKSFINYLGVGADAQAALQVHNLRESDPSLFFSRFFNKAWYALAGGGEAIKSSCANLSEQITLVADGVEIPLPPDSQGIIFLNIDSYSGGVPMWSKGLKPLKRRARRYSEGDFLNPHASGLTRNDSIEDLTNLDESREITACDLPSSCQDGLLDVVSIRGTFHLGQIRVGLSNAQLLCQCRVATVTLKKKIAVQIDGEPWRQNPSTLQIVRKPKRANMLHRSAEDSGGLETEVTKLLNWANERDVIDPHQYALMMEEFSRRVEHKKRKHKEKGAFAFS